MKDFASNEPVPFASVVLQGTMNGTSTDADGNYQIEVPADGILVFSSMGYKTIAVPVAGKAIHNILLEPDAEALKETIVVAFGTATKESFTGSAAVVNEEKLAKSQVASVTDALAGTVAGVQLTSANGAPGSASTIRIRGFSSISAGKAPLVILDGAPYEGDISTINPADVETMTVLKDAASNALYGARGANGVIMITTKTAKRGEAQVTFDAKVGVNNRALVDYDVIKSPAAYYEMQYSALDRYYQNKMGYSPTQSWDRINANIAGPVGSGGFGYDIWAVPAGEAVFGTNGKINPNATLGKVVEHEGEKYLVRPDDWSDYAYRQGIRQEYNLNVSGANAWSSFYASIGYLDNQGIIENSDMSRLSARLRADYQAKKWLKVGANMSYSNYEYNSLGNNGTSTSTANVWAFTSQMAPIYPLFVRNADGSVKVDSNGFEMMDYGDGMNAGFGRSFIGDANPIMDLKLNTRNTIGNQFSAAGFIDVDIFKDLKLTVNGTVGVDEYRQTYVYNPYYGQFADSDGTVSKGHSRLFTYNLQQLLNYGRSFGLHNVSVLLGHEYYSSELASLSASKSKMFSQENKELSGAAVDGQSAASAISQYNNEGFFLRAQYDYDNKIFVSGSFRRDASSVFHPDYRWGNFWSAGAAYIISKENWFDVPFVNELKLKASVGSQGNDNIGSYLYTDLYDIINSDGSVATQFSSKGNKAITWETNTNFNAGVEFRLLHALSGSVEYFNRMTTDMLFSFPVAPSLGYSTYYANVGDMNNQGVEIDLNATIFDRKNFRWSVNANLTWLKNKIVMIDDEKKTLTAYDADGNAYKGYESGSFFIAEDVSLYTWYLKESAGVDQQTGEALWYKDEMVKEEILDNAGNPVLGEDGKPTYKDVRTGKRLTTNDWTEADYYVSGETTIAPFYGGFGTSFELYGVDFGINFTYQIGGKQYDSTYQNFMYSPLSTSSGTHYHRDLYKSWTEENPSKDIPRLQYEDTYGAAGSTRWLTDASYLNIQNINLGYTLPAKLTKKIDIQSLRFYVSAENVFYFSARRGFDPRQAYDSSTNATTYSPMRTISGGVTIKF